MNMADWERIKKLLGQFDYASLLIWKDDKSEVALHTGVTVSARCTPKGQNGIREFHSTYEEGNLLKDALRWLKEQREKPCCRWARKHTAECRKPDSYLNRAPDYYGKDWTGCPICLTPFKEQGRQVDAELEKDCCCQVRKGLFVCTGHNIDTGLTNYRRIRALHCPDCSKSLGSALDYGPP